MKLPTPALNSQHAILQGYVIGFYLIRFAMFAAFDFLPFSLPKIDLFSLVFCDYWS